jgi:hypothetical protein
LVTARRRQPGCLLRAGPALQDALAFTSILVPGRTKLLGNCKTHYREISTPYLRRFPPRPRDNYAG